MKKILISLNNETINFRYKIDKTKEDKDLTKTLMNTNVISNDELIFSDSYLKANCSVMCSFLKELIVSKGICKIVIEEFDIVPIVLDITNSIKNLTKLYIIPDKQISYKIYEKLCNCSYLKYISCFEIPSFMLEKLCDNGIVVDLRCEIVSLSNFVYHNNLVNYTKLYYRKTIKIFTKMDKEDIDDFETFCQINRNLKTIYIYDFDVDMIETIYTILEKSHKTNIKILIHQNLDNTSSINSSMKKLKLINKKLIKYCNSKIKIIYSLDYIKKNFVKQLSITNIKTCLLIVVLLEILILVSVRINNSKTQANMDEINEIVSDLSMYFDDIDVDYTLDNGVVNSEEKVVEIAEQPVITAYNTKYEESFNKLLEINGDTKGWLKLNNTTINFPVVQTVDNDFYLNHDYNKETNSNGWVFVDYRNNMVDLDQNTIIYGHNTKANTMFATLKYVLKESWYQNSDNQIIIFNTPTSQMKFKLFSVYVVDNTNDYLTTTFNEEEFIRFIDLIKGRSIYDFGVDVLYGDKIITLSTCSDRGDKRLVVHGKMIK